MHIVQCQLHPGTSGVAPAIEFYCVGAWPRDKRGTQVNDVDAEQWRFTDHVDGRTVDVLISEKSEGFVLEAHVVSKPGALYRFAERLGDVTDPETAYRNFLAWLQLNLR